ncbi:hypothetical protein [Rhizobium sp. P28RR-XV]|uniref:hypothetical protein n=1 Tax=Rhizobium sp. P28RR-XV TaxID=2726737 RepID=UPI001457590F|nr:hypothetical protein [Rhizobium sp. P28RR-XV]NLR86264.1 hypothetical protein [Rhizobium sp. P28RR-XV]
MTAVLITEIQQAQLKGLFLSRADRGALIVRILIELKTQRALLRNVPADRLVLMDRLIARASSMMPEIANMQVAEFNRVLSEFEKLLATLDDISHTATRH